MQCRVCGNEQDNRAFEVPEMMFGSRTTFDYFQCALCGCLQIAAYPADIERHYPPGYYSYDAGEAIGLVERLKRRLRDRYELSGRGRIGRYVGERHPNELLRVMKPVLQDRRQRILEVGCGSGTLLKSLHAIGFKDLTGADPFIAADIRIDAGFAIHKRELADVPGRFDLVMFHHSLEHLPDQHAVFGQIVEHLSPRGRCVVRVPLSSSQAWEQYGIHWVQLDAPRHFYLHSVESLRRLGESAGLRLSNVVFDSTPFQFWGSEQYRQGIALQDDRSVLKCKVADSIFTHEQMAGYRRQASELNVAGRGDQAAFFFERSG